MTVAELLIIAKHEYKISIKEESGNDTNQCGPEDDKFPQFSVKITQLKLNIPVHYSLSKNKSGNKKRPRLEVEILPKNSKIPAHLVGNLELELVGR